MALDSAKGDGVMVDIPSIAGALNSVKILSDLVKGGIALRDQAKLLEHLVELRSELLSAHERTLAIHAAHTTLIEEKRALEAKIAEFEKWEAEKQRYQLTEIATGVFAYTSKRDSERPEPAHMICAKCYEDRRKSILQSDGISTYGQESLICSRCTTKITRNHSVSMQRPRRAITENDF